MAARNTQAVATGCLARVFTLIGLFWLGVTAFDVVSDLQSGGNIRDYDFIGAAVPALAFLFAGRVMGKRAREAAADDTFVAPSTPAGKTHKATKMTQPSSQRGPTPQPVAAPELGSERPGERRERSRPVPELPPIEPAPDPGALRAVEELGIEDFEPDKPLSSEERLQRAREKYLPKHPETP